MVRTEAICPPASKKGSRTIGEGVPEESLYSLRLEELLTPHLPASRVEVINLGVFGYSSEQGLVQLRREALDWEPDLVYWGPETEMLAD